MPELSVEITGVEACRRNLTPLLHFMARICNATPDETIQAVLLNAQIQIQSPRRNYTAAEQQNLVELFGPPDAWGQTLRNRPWTHTSAVLGPFRGFADAVLAVPCTFDLGVASAKYFQGLEGGDVPLLFLFSGSIFYLNADGRLQVVPISWNTECVYRMPLDLWRAVMEQHYANTGWLSLRRDIFDRLYDFRRRQGLMTWEETIEELLQDRVPVPVGVGPEVEREEAPA